jgi:hypothetical protein
LKIADFFTHLLKNHPQLLFGGASLGRESRNICKEFWKKFRDFQPNHDIYTKYDDHQRECIVPVCLHGDKGRGLKKSPLFCFSWESVFGLPESIRQQASKHDTGSVQRKARKQNVEGKPTWECCKRMLEQDAPANFDLDEGSCPIKRRKLGDKSYTMPHNGRGNTLLTRFLCSAIPAKTFKKTPTWCRPSKKS